MARPGKTLFWWDNDVDRTGRPIRADVRAAAHSIWDKACGRVQTILGDMSDAPELMERCVEQVSRYLDRTGAGLFTQNTQGILMCAFCRALRRYATRLQRLQFVGGSADLSDRQFAPDWAALADLRLDLERLAPSLTRKCRTMLRLRSGGSDWKEIAEVLQMTDIAARAAFWREVKRAKLRAVKTGPQQKHQITARRSPEKNADATRVRGKPAPGSRCSVESASSLAQDS